LFDLKAQNRRNSKLFRGFCVFRSDEDGLKPEWIKGEIIIARALKARLSEPLFMDHRERVAKMAKPNTLGKLKQQERQVREDLIVEAARNVFGAKTYDKVSMNEIAKAAGIGKSSIYTYFPNQEALFVEIAYRDTQSFIATLKQALEDQSRPSLELLIDAYLDYIVEHEPYWRMITHFALHGNIAPEAAQKLNLVSRQVMDLLEVVFIRHGSKGDTRLLSHTLFATLSGIMISFWQYPGRSRQERMDHMKRIGTMVAQMLSVYTCTSCKKTNGRNNIRHAVLKT
jgi:AcrR family transcriptional regulator